MVQYRRALAQLYQNEPEAAASFQKIINNLDSWTTGEKDQTAPMREGLALAYQQQGMLQQAATTMQTAIESSRRINGASFPQTRRMLVELADILRLSGDVAGARHVIDGDVPIDFVDLPEHHPFRAELLRERGLLESAAGDVEAARKYLGDVMVIFDFDYGREHWKTKRGQAELAALAKRHT